MMKKFLLSLFALVATVAFAGAGIAKLSAQADAPAENNAGISLAADEATWELVKSLDYATSTWQGWNFNSSTHSFVNGTLQVTNETATSQNYELQYHGADGFEVEEGVKYQLRITMKGEPNGTIFAAVCDWGHNGQNGANLNFTAENKTLVSEFTSDFSANCFVMLQSGLYVGTYNIAKIELYKEVGGVVIPKDWKEITATEHTKKENNGDFVGVYDNEEGIAVLANAGASTDWDSQFWMAYAEQPAGTKIQVTFDVKADMAGQIDSQVHGNPGSYIGGVFGKVDVTTEWQTVTKTYNNAAGAHTLAFNLCLDKANTNTYYFKNIKVEAWLEVEEELDETVTPAFINGEEEITLNDHSSVSVEAAQALKVGFGDNAAKIKYATYVVNEMTEQEDWWTPGLMVPVEVELATGILNMNNFGYAEFEEPLTFYYGHKYNISIKAWDVERPYADLSNPIAPIASFACEFNGATDAPAELKMGEPQIALRNGSEIEVADWAGLTISFPENNIASALAGTDALEYGAIATIVTDATLSKDGEVVANEFRAKDEDYNSVTVFANETLEGGAAYTIVIPAGGLKVVNQMEYDENWDPKVLWSNAEEITFEFSTAVVKSVTPVFVLGEEQMALNSHSEVSVDMAEGLLIDFENMPEVAGVSYAINAMKMVVDEEGATWVADESYDVAVGEISMNTKAYVAFDEVLNFNQGDKFQLKLTVYGMDGSETVSYYIFNGGAADVLAVAPALVNGDEIISLSDHSNVSVEAANAIVVNVMNAPEAMGATYMINEMNMGQDDEGTFWTVGAEVAVGEMNLNGMGYSEFEAPINFEYGKKYQVSVTVFGGDPTADPQEMGTFTYEFNGSYSDIVDLSGDYIIKNVATGTYLNGSNDWGTKASVTKHGQFMTLAMLEDGKYTIDSHISNGGANHFVGAGDNTFLDAAAANHTITMDENGVVTIMDVNGKYLATNDANTAVNFNATEVTEAAQWVLVEKADIYAAMAEASAEAPVDITALIPDADFSRNNTDFNLWGGEAKMGKGGPNAAKDATAAGMNAEKWGGNSDALDMSYALTGLPNGTYEISFQGFYRYNNTTANTNDVAAAAHADGSENINAVFMANEEVVPFTSIADEAAVALYGKMPFSQAEASEAFTVGAYVNKVTVNVEDGNLTLAVKKLQHEGCDWTVMDNIEVYYLGEPAPELAIIPSLMFGNEETTLNSHSNVSVDMADAIKVIFENGAAVRSALYSIEEAIYEDGELTYGEVIATGELDLHNIGYAEFPEAIKFEYGKQYWVRIMAFGQGADNEEPGQIEVTTPIATFECMVNGSYEPEIAIIPALILGEEETTLNSHSNVSVDMAEAIKVQFENGAAIRSALYTIDEAIVEDGELTYGEPVATGELSLNNFGYAQFEAPVAFEYGKQYWVRIMAFGEAANNEEPGQTVVPTPIATFECLINGSYVEEIVVTPMLVNGEEEYNVTVAATVATATGLAVNVENCPEAIGATYAINEMIQGEDEEGTFWHVGAEVAVGEMSMNSIAFAEFEQGAINFEYGKKYQLTVTVFGQPASDPVEVGTYTFEFNGAYEAEQSELMAYILGGGLFSISSNGLNLNFNDQNVAWTEEASNYQFAVEAPQAIDGEDYTDQYVLRIYENGKPRDFWGQQAHYLNFQPEGGSIIFGLWNNNQNGTDVKNGAVFTIEETEDGILFKNVARGLYLSANGMSADAAACVVAPWSDPNAINGIMIGAKDGKFMQNGKVVIVKNGKTYNMNGMLVK